MMGFFEINIMIAFLFDSDDESLSSFYGLDCIRPILQYLEDKDLILESHILRGDLLPHVLCRKINKIKKDEKIFMTELGFDHNFYKLIIAELIDSMSSVWNTLNIDRFLDKINNEVIYTIAFDKLDKEMAEEIDTFLKSKVFYLGALAVDAGNPLHHNLFNMLVDGLYYKNNQLHCLVRLDEDIETVKDVAEIYKENNDINILETNNFDYYALKREELSERGRVSLYRIENKIKTHHYEKIAEHLINNQDVYEEFSFAVDRDQKIQFYCEEKKLREYLLNVDHKEGASKAKFFIELLDIKNEDWEYLADQVNNAMRFAKIKNITFTPHGVKYTARIKIIGRNLKEAILTTAWIIDNSKVPRLVTVIPGEKKDIAEFEDIETINRICEQDLVGNEKFERIYELAHNAGLKAIDKLIPTPMFLNGYSPIFQGMCGFAWIHILSARTPFVKWLKINNIGRKHYNKGWVINVNIEPDNQKYWDWQSIEPKEAYANEFAKVLKLNGIECIADSRLD